MPAALGWRMKFGVIAPSTNTESWLGKPVIAINAATCWWALRVNGHVLGFGASLDRF
jgi:maleate cis-trans isomerase